MSPAPVAMEPPATIIRPEPGDAPSSLGLVRRYLDELHERLGIDARGSDLLAEAVAYRPPSGTFLVVRQAQTAVGCGASRAIGPDVAEFKRMWVAPAIRGRGVGTALLRALEAEARRGGQRIARLDTRRDLIEAVSVYRRAGYREVPAYNDNPHADVWFEKAL